MSSYNRQKIIKSIEQLPNSALSELANFIDYLQFKISSNQKVDSQPEGVDFLLKIAGIGESNETDLSERDEEILAQEININSGWSVEK